MRAKAKHDSELHVVGAPSKTLQPPWVRKTRTIKFCSSTRPLPGGCLGILQGERRGAPPCDRGCRSRRCPADRVHPRPIVARIDGLSSAKTTQTHARSGRLQGLQPPARTTNPVRQGSAVDLDVMSGEDLSLAIERRVIAIFADQPWRAQGCWRMQFGRRSEHNCRLLIDGVDWRAPGTPMAGRRRRRRRAGADDKRSRSNSARAPTALSQRQQVVNVECYVLAR